MRLSGEGRRSSPVVRHLRRGELGAPGSDHVPFWPKRESIFRLFYLTTFIAASHDADSSIRSWSPTALMLAVATSACAPVAILTEEDTLSRELGAPPLPEAYLPVGYCW
jgi:hypothetical protein